MPLGRWPISVFACSSAPSFADIFYNNCFKNGLLPIRLSDGAIDVLFRKASQFPETR